MHADSPVQEIKYVGEKMAAAFQKAGIRTVRDLLYHFPRSYETFERPMTLSEARYRDYASISGVLTSQPVTRYAKRIKITEALAKDAAGATFKAVWFNMPYLSKSLSAGTAYVFRGKFAGEGQSRRMIQPRLIRREEYEALEKTLRPVYTLPKGVTEHTVQKALTQVFLSGAFPAETLSEALLRDYDLCPLSEALRLIHFPEDRGQFLKARKRLVFEEFYRFLLNIRAMKADLQKTPNSFVISRKKETDDLLSKLPYRLTGAQVKTLNEIRDNLSGDTVTNRLIQGDVGSGKTILCFLAMYEAALNGYESVLMAPTEVLAKQHYKTFRKLSETYGLGLRVSLLTGSMTAAEKRAVYEKISTHTTDILVGTHAVIQERSVYEDLALVITDEQHRFGVRQRELLKGKGQDPHMIVLSATPIPRTLGMILYGDMDISVIDELPKDRLPIKTALVDIEYRAKAYKFMAKQIGEGRQCYVICPLVEESEGANGENVKDYAKKLETALPKDVRIAVLHGRMKSEEKEAVMEDFASNRTQVLVSTTVIEVGIDVSNATVMLIENAERFGLAQLHQLRGRVGRGEHQSYCILVDTTCSEESKERLGILKFSNDGFKIASEDLRLRGPGDFFGVRQSGDVSFQLADIYQDAKILSQAEEAVKKTEAMTFTAETPVL